VKERFTATISEDGIETNRPGKLTTEELEAIDSLRRAGKVVERHGYPAVGMRVVVAR
jgi:hypothetical protein